MLLLAPLVGTGLHVPYHLIVGGQLGASLLSMHIFAHASRFDGLSSSSSGDAGLSPIAAMGAYGGDGNSSSHLDFHKPTTSSSTRIASCAAPPPQRSVPIQAAHPPAATPPCCVQATLLLLPQVSVGAPGAFTRPRRLLQACAAEWLRGARQAEAPAMCCAGCGTGEEEDRLAHAAGRGSGPSPPCRTRTKRSAKMGAATQAPWHSLQALAVLVSHRAYFVRSS